MMKLDDPDWEKTRRLLRENLAVAPPAHPDFINSRVLEAIGRDTRIASRRRGWISLPRLAWAGVGLLLAAAILSAIVLPTAMGPRTAEEFISQVVDARAESGRLSVTAFRVPEDRGVVLWIDGTAFIPSDQHVR